MNSRRISAHSRIFVWLTAVCVAAMMEGFLVNQSSHSAPAAAMVEVPRFDEASPQASHLLVVRAFVSFAFRVSHQVR